MGASRNERTDHMRNFAERPDKSKGFRFRHEAGAGTDDSGRPITTVVDADVHYRLGGTNIWSGAQEARGVELSMSVKEIGGGFESQRLGRDSRRSGLRAFVLPLARNNPKQVARVAEALDDLAPAICAAWMDEHDRAKTMLREAVEVARGRLA